VKIEEKPSGSDTEGPPDSSHDISALEVSAKMDSSSADTDGLLAQESSLVTESRQPDASTLVSSSQKMSPLKDGALTSTYADMPATEIKDEDSLIAAAITESTEFEAPVSADNSALSLHRTSTAASPVKTKNKSTADGVDNKVNISEDKPASTPVVNKT